MPVVDRGVILQARISGLPGAFADLLPQVTGLDRLRDLAVSAADQVPITVFQDGFDKGIGDTDRVIGVLPRYREIGV